jgi:hypothetical protein
VFEVVIKIEGTIAAPRRRGLLLLITGPGFMTVSLYASAQLIAGDRRAKLRTHRRAIKAVRWADQTVASIRVGHQGFGLNPVPLMTPATVLVGPPIAPALALRRIMVVPLRPAPGVAAADATGPIVGRDMLVPVAAG